MDTKQVYSPPIFDHYHKPRYKGTLEDADRVVELRNASCGDSITWYLKIDKAILTECTFQGTGCIISQAAASLLAEWSRGKRRDEIGSYTADTMRDLIKIPLGHTRLACALLPLEALQKGILSHAQSS